MSGDDESKPVQLRNAKDDRFRKIKTNEEAGTLALVLGTGPDDFDDFDDDQCEDSSH